MVPVAIIGGGLAGLHAARLLHQRGIAFALFEARDRLGGRILSTDGFDLGPSWFWPAMHPAMAATVAELGLSAFPQHDDGDVLVERVTHAPPQRYRGFRQQPPSMRIVGGTGALVRAFALGLPEGSIRLDARVTHMAAEGDHVSFMVQQADGTTAPFAAIHVIAAVPPRLMEATLTFEPAIDPVTRLRWRETPTWMAAHAKFYALYDRPFWREAGLSGMAQSMVGPLSEIHDATTASGAAALFGFLGVGAEDRGALGAAALTKACLDQLKRLFGAAAAQPGSTLLMDWTAEPLTATRDDRQGGAHPLPRSAPWLNGAWAERLSLAGSETSASDPGYLAGAIDAAERAVTETMHRLEGSARCHEALYRAG